MNKYYMLDRTCEELGLWNIYVSDKLLGTNIHNSKISTTCNYNEIDRLIDYASKNDISIYITCIGGSSNEFVVQSLWK